ncbi:MAG: iron-sulfur cluster assembly scaffold protein [Methanomassiliicoccales archaeon]|nr:iron-sulfur cluster assembly scaffold protein [Methanomassiliicoccales archaeon]
MTTQFDDLQELVLKEARKDYSETTIDYFMNPRNLGPMKEADGSGKVTGPCGDTMNIWIKVKDGVIDKASFTTDGCGTSIAAASMVTVLATGKTLEEASGIGQNDVLSALGGLPTENEHCAALASRALRAAIKDLGSRLE